MKSSTELLLDRGIRWLIGEAELLRYGVVTGRCPWSATQQPPEREVTSPGSTVPGQRLDRIGTATGMESADRRQQGGDDFAIDTHREQQDPCGGSCPFLAHRILIGGGAALGRVRSSHTTGPSSSNRSSDLDSPPG